MDAAAAIDERGFDSLWSNDHFFPIAGYELEVNQHLDGPIFEGWMTLAGFVARTRMIRLGCMVSSAGYRNPGLLVKMASTLDHASGGRLVLGLGAGWYERDHVGFGYEYPPVAGRLDRLEETVIAVRRLLDGDTVTMDGRWVSMLSARNDPAPLQDRLPLLVGGSGERRTLPVVARHADWWNGEGTPEEIARKNAVIDRLCLPAGRHPTEIFRTVGRSRIEAVRQARGWLEAGGDAAVLGTRARWYATLKNRGTHDIKFTESMLENYRWLRLPWRDALLAASLMYANGSDDQDDRVVVRAQTLLGV
jgi:alkanesulfonate monooxygenase SsuD/methylene tetrahydromethanopterin reductase-like flavin-dependent oxidoreductase (luciferase family)